MTVYVDEPASYGRSRKWAHLFADTTEELHAFAQRLGLKREWFQTRPKAKWDHYDVTEGMRWKAIRLGAVATDRYGASEVVARRRNDQPMLDRIARLRAQKESRDVNV